MIFTDKNLNVNRSEFLLKCNKSTANKVQEYFDVNLINRGLKPGDCLIF